MANAYWEVRCRSLFTYMVIIHWMWIFLKMLVERENKIFEKKTIFFSLAATTGKNMRKKRWTMMNFIIKQMTSKPNFVVFWMCILYPENDIIYTEYSETKKKIDCFVSRREIHGKIITSCLVNSLDVFIYFFSLNGVNLITLRSTVVMRFS